MFPARRNAGLVKARSRRKESWLGETQSKAYSACPSAEKPIEKWDLPHFKNHVEFISRNVGFPRQGLLRLRRSSTPVRTVAARQLVGAKGLRLGKYLASP